MHCIAHRGFAGVNPENTLPAVRRAAAAGADRVEVDARRCGSGELVVIHDEDVERVTDGTGRVGELPLARLRDLEVLDSGAGIPTLAELLETASVPLNVELKERGLVDDALALVDDAGADVLYSAFDPAVVEAVRERGADAAPLFFEEPDRALELARRLDCVAVHPHLGLCEDALLARAGDAGLAVNAWTVRSPEAGRTLADAGVDGLIADAPGYCPDR